MIKAMFTRMAAVIAFLPCIAEASIFQMPGGDTSLQFVTVGDPGNLPIPPATAKSTTHTRLARTT